MKNETKLLSGAPPISVEQAVKNARASADDAGKIQAILGGVAYHLMTQGDNSAVKDMAEDIKWLIGLVKPTHQANDEVIDTLHHFQPSRQRSELWNYYLAILRKFGGEPLPEREHKNLWA